MNSKTLSSQTLRGFAQERLLREMIASADIDSGKKGARPTGYMLIVDEYTLRIVNSVVDMKELMDLKIVGIEKLELKRKAFPKMHAIYFLEPLEDKVRLVEEDASAKLYESIHIYFTRAMPEAIMSLLRAMPDVTKRLFSLKELNLDFLVVDDCQFTLNMPSCYNRLYSTPDTKLLNNIAEKLYTLVSVFLPTCNMEVISERNSLGERVANSALQIFKNIHSRQPTVIDSKGKSIRLVVLDRSFDVRTPAVHDIYYQPMVYDLLKIKNNTVEFDSETSKGEKVKRTCVLNEKDELWLKYRFKHIHDVLHMHHKK